MSEETRDRISKVIEETNYRPSVVARCLNAKSTCLIGVIIGDITNTFANQLVKGIDELARDKRYQIIVGNSGYILENEERYVSRMLDMGVDGFIVQPSSGFHELAKKIHKSGKALVFIDSKVSMDKENWVKTNNYEAVLSATEMMINKGYEEFIMISADPNVLSTRMERASGYLDELKLSNKKCKQIIIDENVSADELTELITQDLKLAKKTLIFVANCWLLPRVYMALKDYRNLIPNKIGLLGFDNLEWTNFSSPTVTTIVQPAYEEGKQAAAILIDAIEDKHEQVPNQILKCTMNWNESTNI